jgi:hypothetical protein
MVFRCEVGTTLCGWQRAAQILVAVVNASCMLWSMVSTKQVTNASKGSSAEGKDKHVRDRVETKETLEGLHGVECIESLMIARLMLSLAVDN